MKKKSNYKQRLIREILEGQTRNDFEVVDAIIAGLPANSLDDLIDAGLSMAEIAKAIGLSQRTLSRERSKRQPTEPLGIVLSDRIVRVSRMIAEADRFIGDRSRALRWLRTSNWALDDRIPLELLATEPGAELVRVSLASIAFGGTA